jgi:hypothetical protein
MLSAAEQTVDMVTSQYVFTTFYGTHREPLGDAIRNGVTVRLLLDTPAPNEAIQRILHEYAAAHTPLTIRYAQHPISHYSIMDRREALVATSTEPTAIESANYYLWTDNSNLVNILQQNFESLWHTAHTANPEP